MRLETARLSVEEALEVARSAALRLSELVQPRGRFIYAYLPETGAVDEEHYNFVRHAACVWAMNQAACALKLPLSFHQARTNALQYLFATAAANSPQKGLCITDRGRTSLGANALAVLALLSHEESCGVAPGSLSLSMEQFVGHFCDHLLAQYTGDGDFVHQRVVRSGEAESLRCDYFNGEALLALLTAEAWCPGNAALEPVLDMFDVFAERGYGIDLYSHWMAYAAEAAFRLRPEPQTREYAMRVARAILEAPEYRDEGIATRIACRTEALLAVLRLLKLDGLERSALYAEAIDAVQTNLALQLRHRLADGAFRAGDVSPVVRIDFLQHNMAGFLGYGQLV